LRTGLIELNDSSIAVSVDGENILQSPGYAVIDGKRLLLGTEAMGNARLLPRWTNTRFWQQLDTNALQVSAANVRHHADLACAHFEQLWAAIQDTADEVVLSIPGDYGRAELGLLLGVAQEAGLPVRALMDTALAAAAKHTQPDLLYLDIHLHRVTLSHLQTDGQLRRSQARTIADSGLYTLWDRWANMIAGQMIQTSRFDPLHQAASEQQLYDLVPGWIAQRDQRPAQSFSLQHGAAQHTVSLSTEQLLGACASLYPQLVQAIKAEARGNPIHLLVSHRFQGFPGLLDALALLGQVTTEQLGADAVRQGTQQHLAQIRGTAGQVSYITSLPMAGASTSRAVAPAATRLASHVLLGSHATQISPVLKLAGIRAGQLLVATEQPRCTLYNRANQTFIEAASDAGVTLNNQPVTAPVAVVPGDTVLFDDQSLTLISTT
jgi:hypothetical protein